MGEVRRHFRDCGWAVKVPRRLKDLQAELNRAREELSQPYGRAPSATELAGDLGIDREAVIQATIASSNYTTLSTDVPTGAQDQPQTVGETIGGIDTNLDKVVDIETLRPLIAALSEQHRIVLSLKFFHNMSQSEIGQRLGCSQMHVSRLLAQALRTLRCQMFELEQGNSERQLAAV